MNIIEEARGSRFCGSLPAALISISSLVSLSHCAPQAAKPAAVQRTEVSDATPLPLKCPTHTRIDYGDAGYRLMLGAVPDNVSICTGTRIGGAQRSYVLNYFPLDLIRPSELERAIKVFTALLTSPVGTQIDWERFTMTSGYTYTTRFTVEPNMKIAVDGRNYSVRVIRATNPRLLEDRETWIDSDSLMVLRYIDYLHSAENLTATSIRRVGEP